MAADPRNTASPEHEHAGHGLSSSQLAALYRKLRLIRRVEEETARIYPSDKIKSPVHLAIGQEASSAAVCDVLKPEDVASGTYRSHAVYLAKGGNVAAMMAEMYGKVTGCCRGKGGSMHIISPEANVLGSSAVVGTNIPIATGQGLMLKREGKGRVCAVFFGDGATEEGCFYESLNFAMLHRLPVLFVCENNGYAIHEPLSKRWSSEDICARVAAFGMPVVQIPDGDVFAMREAAAQAVERMRRGEGPTFIECKLYRWREHVGPAEDFDQGYRPRSEAEAWMANDQVARVGNMLPAAERAGIDAEVEAVIADAVDFAESSAFPPAEELYANVYA
ncbi:thiamine pyrophosphate-dependent dehydrogenase E1 component subunit alpha [Ferrovibrio terrae]|uniref:Thiamine pyrophosphate-dependent dehydrogenase E1 component subunit alpha n=1 Tax=Ferrovibrio terrae TaxID=2594003 RepID=A0A516GXR9_9PROT|nr:thiamine pyrophosphate-dependent dehydrogenase E1 component subunit alpha [Ferrovibrio terrae]QDO96338.1 thiamine pyrophosphate-dependent dehydrogenase E1 component subunit alpha [Ferrovibrio terrae]